MHVLAGTAACWDYPPGTLAGHAMVYEEDLAFVHDTGFDALAAAAARMVRDLHPPCRVVDLGCGGGTLLDHLAARGYDPWGLDVSPAMIRLARRRLPAATLHVASAYDAALPPCGVVTAIGEVFNYTDGGASSDHDARVAAAFERIHDALEPGGIFLFDIATMGRAPEPTRAERRGRDWRVVATAQEREGILVRTLDTWRATPTGERHGRETHRLRLWNPDDVEAMLRRAGFDVERLAGYDDYAFQPGWDGFLARPRA